MDVNLFGAAEDAEYQKVFELFRGKESLLDFLKSSREGLPRPKETGAEEDDPELSIFTGIFWKRISMFKDNAFGQEVGDVAEKEKIKNLRKFKVIVNFRNRVSGEKRLFRTDSGEEERACSMEDH